MFTTLKSMLRDDQGQTMAEYGLLLALIAVVVIVAATFLGTQVSEVFSSVANSI